MIRRFLSKVRGLTDSLKTFGSEFVDALPEMAENFVSYWENQRFIAYFIIYSFAVSMLLAGLGVTNGNYWLMVGILAVYALTALPMFYRAGQEYHDEDLDPEDLI